MQILQRLEKEDTANTWMLIEYTWFSEYRQWVSNPESQDMPGAIPNH